jgi:multidrug efflux pump subunit AcrA (membrane-fusion protein)
MTNIRTPQHLHVVGGALLLIGVTATACSSTRETDHADRGRADTAPPIAVTIATVATTNVTDTFEAGGVVQARSTATLTARILAPVLEIHVAPGDRVRTGQSLLVLDGRDLAAQSRGAQAGARAAGQGATAAAAEQRAAQAALTLAQATHDRIAALHTRKSATAQELDVATAALHEAEARLAGAAARVLEAASRVEGTQATSQAAAATESYTRVTAPFDGVVTEKMVEVGYMASPGAPLLRVEDTRSFRLDVRVDESRARQVSSGATVGVLLDADEGEPRDVKGVVSEISRAVSADARAFLVKIALPSTAGLRSGMFGRATFPGSVRQALTVPDTALVRQGQVTSVFVVADGVARLRLVHVRGTEVLAGLSAGETVVLSPASGIADGRSVTTGGHQ